jgi:elongation factor Ts
MLQISAKLVQQLRENTGVGMMKCKQALVETNGDINKAAEWLRMKGIVSAGNMAHRRATEGLIGSYIHTGSKVGVLVEVNCETDFVARTEDFQVLVQNIAMQVAAYQNVEYVTISDIPADVVSKEKALEMSRDDLANKPENIKEKIVQGRIDKRLKEMCLLYQPYIRDQSVLLGDVLKQASAKLGENIQIRRFVRFVLGEKIGL